jgi:ABC-type bacteriocin/lantibiotic exporter with double-glycine peptidase domain
MQIFKKLIFLLSSKEKKQAIWLLLMILIMAALDTIGVASIMPFVAVISNPSLVETNLLLNSFFKFSNIFGVVTMNDFLFLLGVLVFITLIISLSFKAVTVYFQLRFVRMCEYTISKRLVEGYLNQPYSWFLHRNSADLGKTILSEVSNVVTGGILTMMDFISKSMVAIALLSLLIIVDAKLALTVGLTLSIIYAFITKINRSFLSRIAIERIQANKERFIALSEALGAIKDIKISGLEKTYLKRFANPAQTFAKHQASSKIISQLPRYALEAVAFGGMLLVILYLMSKSGSFRAALPIITIYALAGYRLLPAIQSIYVCITSLRFVKPAIDSLSNDLKEVELTKLSQSHIGHSIKLKNQISIKDAFYEYPKSSRTALKNINLTIPAKSNIGLVGPTGSGKTTLVDIILGLLVLEKGRLEIDGKVINKNNLREWQSTIGYVPQHIYLADDTISSNIAFGIDQSKIDHKAVEQASKIANLHEFVLNELPNKYSTIIGERGTRLSGGQRQRIGIARALYNKPCLLVMDEATSALDSDTEKAVMDAINNLDKDITIILIAHRLNTVKNCDIIFELSKGELISQDTFLKYNNRI